jgi:hypothetical protein
MRRKSASYICVSPVRRAVELRHIQLYFCVSIIQYKPAVWSTLWKYQSREGTIQ